MPARPRLLLVSPDSCGGPDVARLVALLPAIADDVDAVILRWKGASAREQLDAARRLSSISPRPQLLLSDRFDVARAAALDGLQLPEDGASPEEVRRAWPDAMIGVSRHDAAGARDRSRGASFALMAPVFPTKSKPGGTPLGLERLAAITREASCPLVALGGIDRGTAGDVLACGVAGVAVRGAVFGDADPVARVRELRAELDSAAASLPDHQFVAGPDGRVRPE